MEEQTTEPEEVRGDASTTGVDKIKSMGSMSRARFGKSMSRLRVRRNTLGFGGVPGIKPVERTSQLGMEFKRPPLIFLNTFQLNPNKKFHIANVLQQIDELLDENFTSHRYNVQESTGLSIRLASELMRTLKGMAYNRYRIITVVTVGQRRAQSYNNAVAFIWDHERDSYVNTQRDNTTAFIQVTVFAIYLD